MQTIGAIFLLALVALGVSVYTDEVLTSTQLQTRTSDSAMSVGFSRDLSF